MKRQRERERTEITWNYVKNGYPLRSGKYLWSINDGDVIYAYWNKRQKSVYVNMGDDVVKITTAYAWAKLPKAAVKND